MASDSHKFQMTLRTPSASLKPQRLYILVMGLTGAGKSTFISIVTGSKGIPIGEVAELDGVTQEVQDYVLLYKYRGKSYEIHFVDSPGFDDGAMVDAEVLNKLMDYVNTNYKLKERLAGVLYLHDITKGKIGGTAQRNIRMLEKMIGVEKFNNCTLVTTKWGCSKFEDEKIRETTLCNQEKYFGLMLHNEGQGGHHKASTRRFEPRTNAIALSIIEPYLENKFTPNITREMADPHGPRLALGETEAGKVVADRLEQLAQATQELGKVEAARQILAQKYDETLFEEFKQKRKKLRRQIRLQRSGRWVMRTTIVGGAIVATILTLGPGASAFVLEPAYEKAVRGQRRNEQRAKNELEEDFKNRSKSASYLRDKNPSWLWTNKVQKLEDLDSEAFSIRSKSSENILDVAREGEKVGVVVDERAGEGKIEDIAEVIEESEDSESGSDTSGMN